MTDWTPTTTYKPGDVVRLTEWERWPWYRRFWAWVRGDRERGEYRTWSPMAETDRLNGLKDQIHAYYESLLKSMQGDLDAALARVRELEARLPQTAPCVECGRNEWEHPMAVCKCGNRIFW